MFFVCCYYVLVTAKLKLWPSWLLIAIHYTYSRGYKMKQSLIRKTKHKGWHCFVYIRFVNTDKQRFQNKDMKRISYQVDSVYFQSTINSERRNWSYARRGKYILDLNNFNICIYVNVNIRHLFLILLFAFFLLYIYLYYWILEIY